MTSKSAHIIEVLQKIHEKKHGKLRILETGTIRNLTPEYAEGDGHSTIYIAEWLSRITPKSTFISIDLKTDVSRRILNERKLLRFVHLVRSDSLKALPQFKNLDFCYLDSENDAELTLNEFLIVWPNILPGGAVMVDDCTDYVCEKKKGVKLIPYLKEKNIEFKFTKQSQIIVWK